MDSAKSSCPLLVFRDNGHVHTLLETVIFKYGNYRHFQYVMHMCVHKNRSVSQYWIKSGIAALTVTKQKQLQHFLLLYFLGGFKHHHKFFIMQQLNMEEKMSIQGSAYGRVVNLFSGRGFPSLPTYRYRFSHYYFIK